MKKYMLLAGLLLLVGCASTKSLVLYEYKAKPRTMQLDSATNSRFVPGTYKKEALSQGGN
jgi:uncharacterized lipoprotein YmbA